MANPKKVIDLDRLDASLFELVEQDSKKYDKTFETKPIGYFKDAMLRFARNRTNLVATIILFILIGFSVLVPLLTTKNYTSQDSHLRHLPPRMPILQNFGIFDGYSRERRVNVDPTLLHEEIGLPLPTENVIRYGTDYRFIDFSTYVYYTDSCSERVEACVEGESMMRLNDISQSYAIRSLEFLVFDRTLNPTITFDIDYIEADTELRVYLQYITEGEVPDDDDDDDDDDDAGDVDDDDGALDGDIDEDIDDQPTIVTALTLIGTISSAGVHTIDVFNVNAVFDIADNQIAAKVEIELVSDVQNATVTLNSIAVNDDENDEDPLANYEGLSLSRFERFQPRQGDFIRINAIMHLADFMLDVYERQFGARTNPFMAESTYKAYLEDARCGAPSPHPDDPSNPNMGVFPEACPLISLNGVIDELIVLPGRAPIQTFTYDVTYNFALVNGYSSTPFFLFGTTGQGFDLFAITWVALRTSLLIGLVVATINISVGIVYGAISGYYGGKVDILMERFSEIVGRVPWLVWLSIFVALIGPGVVSLILILVVSGWIGVASVTRTQFYRFKGREYVLSSRTLGAKDGRLIFRHILPNGIGTIITASILMIPGVIFAEATISYLGFGIGHGQSFRLFGLIPLSGVSIGVLLSDGRNEMLTKPYLTLFPAIIISILMITFNMFGNALRDAFNPSLRGTQ